MALLKTDLHHRFIWLQVHGKEECKEIASWKNYMAFAFKNLGGHKVWNIGSARIRLHFRNR